MTKSKLEFELEYSVASKTNEEYPVIIVAAGSASRMKGIDKITAPLNGIPVLMRTAQAFDNCDNISEIVIVTKAEKIEDLTALCSSFGFKKKISIIEGGVSREDSVRCGIVFLGSEYKKVLVHDAARPLVTVDVIKRVADALCYNDSVACAVKTKDTVKVVNEDMLVVRTLNRDSLVNIQTPQGVNTEMFLDSARKYDLSKFTDDTSVLEAVGAVTAVVEGDYNNLKITTHEDLKIAQAIVDD